MRYLATLTLATFLLANCGQNISPTASYFRQTENNDAKIIAERKANEKTLSILLNLAIYSFLKQQGCDNKSKHESKKNFQTEIKIGGFKQKIGAGIIQTSDIGIKFDKDTQSHLEVKNIFLTTKNTYQLEIDLSIKQLLVAGRVVSKVDAKALGNPTLFDGDLSGRSNIKLNAHFAVILQENKDKQLEIKPGEVHHLSQRDGKHFIQEKLNKFVVITQAKVENAAFSNDVLDKIYGATKSILSDADAKNVRDEINNLSERALNSALKDNIQTIENSIVESILKEDIKNRLIIRDSMQKLAVQVLLK